MIANRKLTCSICGKNTTLETDNPVDEWPRELIYICPNEHRLFVVEVSNPDLMSPPPPTNPNLPIKYKYMADTRSQQELELYCASGNVRRKLGQSVLEAHTFLNLLEDYINGAVFQHRRIEEEYNLSIQEFKQFAQNPFDNLNSYSVFTIQWAFMLDIHFYLICLDKISKLYPRLLKSIEPLTVNVKNGKETRIRRKYTENKFKEDDILKVSKEARNFLEHIDEKIQSGNFNGLNVEKNEDGFVFRCGEHNVRINLKLITDAYEALIRMLYSLPDVD